MVRLHLKKLVTWSNRDEDWKNTNSLFQRRFLCRRRPRILRSLFTSATVRIPVHTAPKSRTELIRYVTLRCRSHRSYAWTEVLSGRAIFVWPWNENARTKQKQQTNGNRAIWLVYRTDTNARGFWLVKRTLGWKNFMPEELSRNRFDVILQHDWSIEQCLLHIMVFFGGKTKTPCFDLFIHWLKKQITNTYSNHFSR